MRRWLSILALSVVATVAVAGCGNPAGVDGELTDDWPGLPEARPFVPAAGVCHPAGFAETTALADYRPVQCATPHQIETAHVGTFAGPAGALPAPPGRDSAEIRTAYAECDGKAGEYVGDDWRHGRLWLGVALPNQVAWTAGARWFRCDLREMTDLEGEAEPTGREASLRGALVEPSPLKLTCYAVKLTGTGRIESMAPAGCDQRHNGEFIGVWRAPADLAYPARDSDWARFYTECYDVLAGYAGVPKDRNLRSRAGIVVVPPSEAEWRAGDHGVRCYLWLSSGAFTRSVEGVGPTGLPLRQG
nr:septum formation family protein [Micromonospora sp. DSM 115978]